MRKCPWVLGVMIGQIMGLGMMIGQIIGLGCDLLDRGWLSTRVGFGENMTTAPKPSSQGLLFILPRWAGESFCLNIYT